jgi:hypothetical protein
MGFHFRSENIEKIYFSFAAAAVACFHAVHKQFMDVN